MKLKNLLQVYSLIFIVRPIATSFLQPDIQLTVDEIAQWSPCDATPALDARLELLVGERETTPFFDQAERFARRLAASGRPPKRATIAGENHMTIVRSLGRPGSPCARRLAATIAASRQQT